MIFDALVKLIEATNSEKMKDMASRARLFHFPINPHKDLPKSIDEVQAAFLKDMFVLPFGVVAVEDNASCVIVEDLEHNEPGLFHKRLFIEHIPTLSNPDSFRDPESVRAFRDLPGSLVTMGVMRPCEVNETQYVCDMMDAFAFLVKDGVVVNSAQIPCDDPMFHSIAKNWMTALEELMLINTPDRFILEKCPVKIRKHPKKIPRSHDRPIYTLLKPSEIRTRIGLHQPTGRHVVSHERRAHPRVLRSEKFKAMRGKTIIIPATWVGPSEKRVHGHYYKVLLDK